jgi:hypothetical protein
MRDVGGRVARRNTRSLDCFEKRATAVDRLCLVAGEGFAPQPLNDGAVSVATMNVECVSTARGAEHVRDVV